MVAGETLAKLLKEPKVMWPLRWAGRSVMDGATTSGW
jgi:hypothetical protein